MEFFLGTVGIFTLLELIKNSKKECFNEVYFDSESYVKTRQVDSQNTNAFSPSEASNQNIKILTGYNNENTSFDTVHYPLSGNVNENMEDFVKDTNLYEKQTINGIPLRDYYENYTKNVLEKNTWFLNKDLPVDTNQYLENSEVQQKLEIFTGERQKRDRYLTGKPNKRETLNLFTPEEKTTGYGYQYGQSGSGPGITLSRFKELELYKQDLKFKTGETPFEKIQVGKGLALDPEVPAAGGFQEYTRILPENISDYKANQLPGMTTSGKWVFSNAPTSIQPVSKNKPNGYYSLCNRGPAAGKSTITAEAIRPDYTSVLKNQNRSTVNYGFGTTNNCLDSYLN